MQRPMSPLKAWLRGAMLGAGVLVVGGIALAGHDSGMAGTPVPAGSVVTLTPSPTASYGAQMTYLTPDTPLTAAIVMTTTAPPAPTVHTPAPAPAPPPGAIALCRDGSFGFGKHHPCVGHGGVVRWLTG